MSSTFVEDKTELLCAQQVLFAGRPLLLRTNAPRLLRYARDFLASEGNNAEVLPRAVAKITLIVKSTEEVRGDSAPWFRARGHFALARFSSQDVLWFNLRTREVLGSFSVHFAEDEDRWRRHVFPTLLGILSAVIDVAPVHAACIAHSSGGVLLAGTSGAGKSTLTVSLAQRGYPLLSDDWTYISDHGDAIKAWGLPVPVKLLPDASNFFPELSSQFPRVSLNGEIAYEAEPEVCFHVPRRTHCGVKFIVLLERSAKQGCHIHEISAAEAVDHLITEIEPLHGSLAKYYDRQIDLIRQLKSAICLRASFKSHPRVVAEALDLALANAHELKVSV